MALPPAILTALVRFGPMLDDIGVPYRGKVSFTASRPKIWEATGTPILPRVITVSLDATGSGEIRLPATDQPGFVDGLGNAVSDWTYTALIDLTDYKPSNRVSFQIPTNGESGVILDLDLLIPVPSSTGVVVELPEVLSVAGHRGTVSAQQIADSISPLLPETGLQIQLDTDGVPYFILGGN